MLAISHSLSCLLGSLEVIGIDADYESDPDCVALFLPGNIRPILPEYDDRKSVVFALDADDYGVTYSRLESRLTLPLHTVGEFSDDDEYCELLERAIRRLCSHLPERIRERIS